MNGMTKQIQDMQAMMKFMLKQQNPELDDDDVDELMVRVLGKQSSATLPPSFASTHNPNFGLS